VNSGLFLLQRGTALILAFLVLAHLAVIVVAVHGGLTATEILSRTRGSVGWGLFYGAFVLIVAVHGSIGLNSILSEWFRLGHRASAVISWAAALILLALGLRAVWAVTVGGAA